MTYQKTIIFIAVIILAAVASAVYWEVEHNTLVKDVIPEQIDKISIEVMPKSVDITDKGEIDKIIDKLQLEKWSRKKEWDLQYFPSLFIGFQEGEFIGLFGSGEKYAKIETEGKGEYYIVPTEIYDDIMQIYQKHAVGASSQK